MKTPRSRPACPRAELHTPIPAERSVREWAGEMNRTHLQVRCPGCDLYACWIPRVLLPALSCARCPRTDGLDWTEARFHTQEPAGRLVPLCPDHWNDGDVFPGVALLPYSWRELLLATADVHRYLSTACHHGEHGNCRNQCKFCPGCCICPCHLQAGTQPATGSPVDQARAIALELLEHAQLPPELAQRITTAPDLFWLRGEVAPPGSHTEPS